MPPATGLSPNPVGRAILLMVGAILLFTLLDATAKGLSADYSFVVILWARLAVQLALVAAILRGRLWAEGRTRYPLLHVARALTQIGAGGFFFAALPQIGLAEATALADLNPVLVTLGAALFLGERLGPRRILGVAVAMLGAMLILRPGADVFTPAALLPLGCALCYAANVLLTRAVGAREGLWTPMVLTSAIATGLVTLALPFAWTPVAAGDVPLFLLIGALGTGSQLLLIRSYALAEASVVAPFAYLGIVFATLWGVLFFGEVPDGLTLLGAAVIAGAGIYIWHRETRGRA